MVRTYAGLVIILVGLLWGFVEVVRTGDQDDSFPWWPLVVVLAGVNLAVFDALTRLQQFHE